MYEQNLKANILSPIHLEFRNFELFSVKVSSLALNALKMKLAVMQGVRLFCSLESNHRLAKQNLL